MFKNLNHNKSDLNMSFNLMNTLTLNILVLYDTNEHLNILNTKFSND